MKILRKKAKPVSVLMTLLLFILAVPYQSVFAEIIETEQVISQVGGQQARNYLSQILVRKRQRRVSTVSPMPRSKNFTITLRIFRQEAAISALSSEPFLLYLLFCW
jgi:hypothetical protein